MQGINWDRRRYTKEEFQDAWNSSLSVAECIRKLGYSPGSGHYRSMNSAAISLGLTRDHMTGMGWNVGNKSGYLKIEKRPIESYLVNPINVNSDRLKRRLINEGYLEAKCSAPYCPITFNTINPFTGEDSEIKLTLDHIDGDHFNNEIENLRILCTYCHPYTETWGHKGKGRKESRGVKTKTQQEDSKKSSKILGTTLCGICKMSIKRKSYLCIECYRKYKLSKIPKATKIDWPLDNDLIDMVKSTSYLATSKVLGVSDNALRKRLKNRGYDLKTFEKYGIV